MSLGVPMGRWMAHTYTTAAAVLIGGLNDGALWILNVGGKPTEAGIWPQVPNGGGGGDCAGGPALFVIVHSPGLQEQLDILAGTGGPLTSVGGVGFVIQNPV